ncbi:hypothetical protein WME82_28210 [Sorangium sp. So ce128]
MSGSGLVGGEGEPRPLDGLGRIRGERPGLQAELAEQPHQQALPALLEAHGAALDEETIEVDRLDPAPEPLRGFEEPDGAAGVPPGEAKAAVEAGDAGAEHDRIELLHARPPRFLDRG